MNTNQNIARVVGILFLTAMVASLVGGGLVESVITDPDYLVTISENRTQVMVGVFLEIINAMSVVGIGILMFTILKPYNETIALGYFGFRVIEAVFCSMIVISPLSLMNLSDQSLQTGIGNNFYVQTTVAISLAERASFSGLLIPLFLSLGAFLFYYALYQSRLLPRFISIWGLIAAALILCLNIVLTLNVEISLSVALPFALPIILNEIFLGFWLIFKGFDSSAIVSGSVRGQYDPQFSKPIKAN